RRHTATSIHRYLDQLRLRRAMGMVEGGGRTMAQIALAVGYTSESHFSDSFKRGMGVRPSEFRAKLRGARGGHSEGAHHGPAPVDMSGVRCGPGAGASNGTASRAKAH